MQPDLLDRLLGYLTSEQSHLAVPHPVLLAAMREIQRGRLTQNQVKNALALTDADVIGLTTVYNKLFGPSPTLTVGEYSDLLVLGETRNRADATGGPYYTKATVKSRLGL